MVLGDVRERRTLFRGAPPRMQTITVLVEWPGDATANAFLVHPLRPFSPHKTLPTNTPHTRGDTRLRRGLYWPLKLREGLECRRFCLLAKGKSPTRELLSRQWVLKLAGRSEVFVGPPTSFEQTLPCTPPYEVFL